MVEALVSYAVERLGDSLIRKAVFLKGVRNEVQWLRDELRSIHGFLKDAEEKKYGDATICGWVSDITELAYDVEDLLDTVHLKVHGEADDDGDTMEAKPKSGCLSNIPVCSCFFDKGKEQVKLYNIGKDIEELKNRLTDISRRRRDYGLRDFNKSEGSSSSTLGKLRDIRRVTSFEVDQQNVVGFEDEADELLGKLLSSEPRRFTISIYGMGGLGKTTIAGKLYHNDSVRKRFKCRAWVCVSQYYKTRDLLQRVIKSFEFESIKREEIEKMNEEDLGRFLRKSLQELSYLVVIDDVWDKEAWATLKKAFPNNTNGSRVIITTRNKEVAERSDERTHAHKLRFLRFDESWELFRKKITSQNVIMDQQLEKMGREMVQKCDGLPLAIHVLGGLLSTKKPQEWRLVHNHIWRHLKNDSIEISYLLALSFNYLPYQLKQCFLYIGVFPEDYMIHMGELIYLFVAEGFIPQEDYRLMEDVAKDYLDELINRNLLQVETSWRKDTAFRIHDLLRDLAIEKSKDLKFFYIYNERKFSDVSPIISSCSRHVVHSNIKPTSSWLEQCNPGIRSLLLFDYEQRFGASMCRKFKSLRVLNVGNMDQGELPKEMENLIQLKYLNVERTSDDLSSLSISNLQKLQTLRLCGNFWGVQLPAEIGNLKELRHIIADFIYGSLSINSLEKLQTLKNVCTGTWAEIKTEKLINLRDLGLVDLGHFDQKNKKVFSLDSVANLKSLQILSVGLEFPGSRRFESLQPLSYCQHLIDLRLSGTIEKLPEDINEILPNLECLSLQRSHLKDDPMPLLEKLPSLVNLYLGKGFYSGEKLICSAKGFLRLEIMQFYVDDDVTKELQLEEGALPRVRVLRIPDDCKLITTSEAMRKRILKALA